MFPPLAIANLILLAITSGALTMDYVDGALVLVSGFEPPRRFSKRNRVMRALAVQVGATGPVQAAFRADSRVRILCPKDLCMCMRKCLRLRFLCLSGDTLQTRNMLMRILRLRFPRNARMVTV